jgi:hypothetical protein
MASMGPMPLPVATSTTLPNNLRTLATPTVGMPRTQTCDRGSSTSTLAKWCQPTKGWRLIGTRRRRQGHQPRQRIDDVLLPKHNGDSEIHLRHHGMVRISVPSDAHQPAKDTP